MRINTNINSIMARNNLTLHNQSIEQASERLSSGKRINSAADDAAGLAISQRMTSDIRGSAQGIRNAIDGISYMQTAEGALKQVVNMLQRSRELILQGANGTNSAGNKAIIQQEIEQISLGIKDILVGTSFNNQDVFDNATELTGKAALEFWLETSWIPESSKLIEDHFGLNGKGKSIELVYTGDGPGGVLASVSWTSSGGVGDNLKLNIDPDDFPTTGYPSGDGSTNQDRVIAHEAVHAVMAVNMNMSAIPGWFTEGAAEFIHGADDRVNGDIAAATGISNLFVSANFLSNTAGSPSNSAGYSVGYVAVRMLDQQIKDEGNADGIKALMAELVTRTQASTLTSMGDFNAAVDSLIPATTSAAFYTSVTGGAASTYISAHMNLTDDDTGSIHGSDYGGDVKSAIDVINNEPIQKGANDLQLTGLSARSEGGDTTISFQLGGNEANRIVMDRIFVDNEAISVSSITVADTEDALTKIDHAIQTISKHQGTLGAFQNRLNHSVNSLRVFNEQTSAARSTIMDADIAQETSVLTRSQVLMQAAQSMLAQANSQPQQVLSLLQ
ncbi:MAG: flagellinolysin [Oceanospirillaceae bacterium]|nr:flagellinolysin [Oceanospirillaceae bacterium]